MKEYDKYKSKREREQDLDHQFDRILQCLKENKLSGKQYHRLLRMIVRNVRHSAHLSFDIGGETIDAVTCSIFTNAYQTDPSYHCLNNHTKDFNNYIDIKCKGNTKLQAILLGHIISSRKWKQIATNSLQIKDSLDLKETIQQGIYSNMSLRRFSTGHAKTHTILGQHVVASEAKIRQALSELYMDTESYQWMNMAISEAERQYHNGDTNLQIATYTCDPFELLATTFEDELNSRQINIHQGRGVRTLIVNYGIDKYAEGIAVSLLLGCRATANNSGTRRRPLAYAEKPATLRHILLKASVLCSFIKPIGMPHNLICSRQCDSV